MPKKPKNQKTIVGPSGEAVRAWDLPCGCTPGYGPDATTCDHSCHWVHRFMFTDSPLPV